MAQVTNDVFNHHHGTINDHAEIERTQAEQVRRNMSQIETNGCKQQRERDGEGDDQRAAEIAEEQEENDDDKDDSLGQVVKHRVRRQVQEVASIKEGHYRDALRQHAFVQLLNLLVDVLKGCVRIRALLQQHDALNSVFVFAPFAVLVTPGHAHLAETDFRAL